MFCKSDPGNGVGGLRVVGDNRLSHLSVPNGMKATIYDYPNMQGLSKTFYVGEWNLEKSTFSGLQAHDRASSIKIEGKPVTAPTDPGEFIWMGRQ
jgi:hypothetical protein